MIVMPLPNNIALVHDWLVSMRGGEKCLEALCELFPNAKIFTLVHRKGNVSPTIEQLPIQTSFIQHLPLGISHYQRYLPLYPRAIAGFDLSGFDLVISSSHAAAKGVRVSKNTLHICYCHTPMRYIWDQYEQYFGKGRAGIFTRTAMKFFLDGLRRWDVESSKGVHHFIANSNNVRERIRRIYKRESEVIYPPVDVSRFNVSLEDKGYYLIVSALVPYKRIETAIEAFNKLGEGLVIVGTGSEAIKLKRLAKSNIEFVGWAGDEQLGAYYKGCRALIFPGEEDFGITPVEAMACGKPVITFARGGALETVIDGNNFSTGIFYHDPSSSALIEAVRKLSPRRFDPERLHTHALRFDKSVFKKRILEFVETAWQMRQT